MNIVLDGWSNFFEKGLKTVTLANPFWTLKPAQI